MTAIVSIALFVPFLTYLTLKNISTLRSRLAVTHPANLCMICTLLKFTDPKLSFCHDDVGLSSFTQLALYSVRWRVLLVQGHQRWQQSKANVQFPISLPLQLYACVISFLIYEDLMVINLCFFRHFYPPCCHLKPLQGVFSSELGYESWSKNTRVFELSDGVNCRILYLLIFVYYQCVTNRQDIQSHINPKLPPIAEFTTEFLSTERPPKQNRLAEFTAKVCPRKIFQKIQIFEL